MVQGSGETTIVAMAEDSQNGRDWTIWRGDAEKESEAEVLCKSSGRAEMKPAKD
jgi:hypothetical protein